MALTDFPYNILLFFPEVLYSEIKRTSLIFFVKLQFQPFRWRLLQFKLLSSNILCRLVLTLNSPGTQYAQQSYKVSDSFPFKWINKKWKEGFYVTAMATAGSRWAVVMSRNAGFTAQVCYHGHIVYILRLPSVPFVYYPKKNESHWHALSLLNLDKSMANSTGHMLKATWFSLMLIFDIFCCRLWSLISCIRVRVSIGVGIMDFASPRQLRHGIRQHLS